MPEKRPGEGREGARRGRGRQVCPKRARRASRAVSAPAIGLSGGGGFRDSVAAAKTHLTPGAGCARLARVLPAWGEPPEVKSRRKETRLQAVPRMGRPVRLSLHTGRAACFREQ